MERAAVRASGKRRRQIKKSLLPFLCFFFVLTTLASANVSRIYRDGSFSGSIRQEGPSDGLLLVDEHLDVAFPVIESDSASFDRKAAVTARYRVLNRSGAPVRVPLQFLGLGVSDPLILVNGTRVSAKFAENTGARDQFLEKLTRHRYLWEPKLYEQYFQYLDAVSRGERSTRSSSMIDLGLDGFVAAARKSQELDRLFPQVRRFSAVAFSAVMMPGYNILEITYCQGLFVEGRTAYAGGPVAQVAFDYLLYPALSWPLAPGFEMVVSVRLPDLVHRGWLWDSRETARYRTNLALSPSYDGPAGITALSARYRTIPAEIFTFVIRTK